MKNFHDRNLLSINYNFQNCLQAPFINDVSYPLSRPRENWLLVLYLKSSVKEKVLSFYFIACQLFISQKFTWSLQLTNIQRFQWKSLQQTLVVRYSHR